MAELLEPIGGGGGHTVPVDEDVLRSWMPILEREGFSIEAARRYTGPSWGPRRHTAPRTQSQQRFIAGLRNVAKMIGYSLDISAD